MRFSTLFFDLGSTLVYSKDPWPPIYEKGDRALVSVLHKAGYAIDLDAFYLELDGFLRAYYDHQDENNLERTTFAVLRDLLIQKGFLNVPEPVIRSALASMYAITQQNWYLEEDAIQTLNTLKSLGYRLGIISNTSDDRNVRGIVNRLGLDPFFEKIFTSAALGIRKPDERIFQTALDWYQVKPNSTVMIGDTLNADVQGANNIGIYSIWITRHARLPEGGELAVQPRAVVTDLAQIPPLLVKLEMESMDSSLEK